MTKDEVEKEATASINTDRRLVESVGLFLKWYAEVEHQLDRLIVHVLDMENFEHYDILGQTDSVRRKIEKLESVVDSCGVQLGEEIKKRLTYFNGSCRNRRNCISHGNLMEKGNGIISQSVGKMGDTIPNPVRPRNLTPNVIPYNDIYKHVFWMRDFSADLTTLAVSIYKQPLPAMLEIVRPVSIQPPVNHQDRKSQLDLCAIHNTLHEKQDVAPQPIQTKP